jgi:chromosome segregation ATPase
LADLPHADRRPSVHGQCLLAKGAVVDRWEDGFDSWTPRAPGGAEDTDVDLERESLLRLARELAGQRNVEHAQAREELEQLKQLLRERAEAVAARERELEELQRSLGGRKPPKLKPSKEKKPDAEAVEALAARERAALERGQAVEAREQELAQRQAALEAEALAVEERERKLAAELEAELEAVRSQRSESETDRQLAAAERERLEEREHAARQIEKELAAARIALESERERLEARAREVEAKTRELSGVDETGAGVDPYAEREAELRRLELKLAERERDLALVRQGLDAERNTLLDRERALRRREVADVRQSFDMPLAPPSFSEGLAAFARSRPRR